MPSDTCILSWLEHLWPLYPAQGVLVVGAGNGSSPWIDALERWNATSVTLVEADDAQFQHLQRNMPEREGWQLRKQVVAAETGSVTYHQASSPAENGLLEPENLRALWPNLKTRQKSTRQAISLSDLLAVTEPKANWLLLDCLPAGALLAGAAPALTTCDVIVTRALLPESGADIPAVEADASTITQLLQAQGFCTVATQISRHPGVAHTLHVRDRSAQLTQLNADLIETRKALQHQQVDAMQAKAQAFQAQAAFTQAVAERDVQLQALQGELAIAKQSAQQADEQMAQLKQQLAAVQNEMSQWREAAEKARADAEHAKQGTQQATNKTTQAQQQLTTLQTEFEQAITEREGLRKAQKDALAQLQALQQAKAELIKASKAQLQAQLSEEKAKVEALAQAQVLALENQALKQKEKMVDEKIKFDDEKYKKILSNYNIIISEKDNLLLKVKDLTDIAADRLLKVGQLTEVIKGLK